MIAFYAALGGVIGVWIFLPAGGRGFLVGAVIGALIGFVQRLSVRVTELDRSLASLRTSVARTAVESARAPAATPAAEANAARAAAPPPGAPAAAAAGAATGERIPPGRAPEEAIAAAHERPSPPAPATAGASSTLARRQAAGPSARAKVETHAPTLLDAAFRIALRWLTTGNLAVKAGVIVLLFGMGFLIKEGIDRRWLVLPVEARLWLAAIVGLGLLGLGWRLRNRHRVYALSVQGGGIGMLYLTVYASFAVFALMPQVLAFFLLVVVTAAAGALAVLQNARIMAVLGIVGGFLAPVLVGSETGSHVLLFGYYAVLNGAIVGVAWFKAWRELNVLGFAFTFCIGSLWGAQGYRPEHFATTEPFLILFTVLYTIVPILFALRVPPPRLRGFVDGTLVFGTPLVAFGLQSLLVGDTEYGLAISACVFAAYYAALAFVLRRRPVLRPLVEAFVALGLALATLAIPLAFDAGWTSAAWALEGAAVLWFGVRQQRRLAVVSGVGLQIVAAAFYVREAFDGAFADWLWDAPLFFNERFLGAVMLATAGFVSSAVLDGVRLRRARDGDTYAHAEADDASAVHRVRVTQALRAPLAAALLAWAIAWWLAAGAVEIVVQAPDRYELAWLLGFVAATTLAATWVAARCAWERIDWLAVAAWPAALCCFGGVFDGTSPPSAGFGALGWAALFAALYAYLRVRERRWPLAIGSLHVGAYWLAASLLVLEAMRRVEQIAAGAWPLAAGIVVAAVAVAAVPALRARVAWPFGAHGRAYVGLGAGAVAALLAVALVAANFASDGAAAPLGFVPLLNPLELALIGAGLALWHWAGAAKALELEMAPTHAQRAAAAAAGAWLLATMAAARAVHHLGGVPLTFETLAASSTYQATLSLIWCAGGCAAMLVGTRRGERVVWLVGLGLNVVVVLKLAAVDLANTGFWRLVSLLGVGVLLLGVGYLSPMPPRAREGRDDGHDGEPAEPHASRG